MPSEVAKIGPYRIAEQIGEGGMGVVYRASAPDGTPVSVKTLRPWLVGGSDGRRRFEREVATLRRVRGARVAAVIDADVEADPPYIVTRYIQGVPLTHLVGEQGPLDGPALRRLAAGLLEALHSVHSAGVVHRDVKPANVIVTDDGPVLIDFGIAHATEDTRLTATGFISGTPGYLAPETVLGRDPTPATDVHGWAATLVFAGTGRPPYGHGPDIAVFDRIRRGECDLGGIEPGIAGILTAALRVDPGERPGVDAASAALDNLTAVSDAATVASSDLAETLAFPPVPPAPNPAAAPSLPPPAPHSEDETAAFPPRSQAPQRTPPPEPQPSPLAASRRGTFRSPLRGHESSVVLALAGLSLLLLLSWAPVVGAIVAAVAVLIGRVCWRIERRLFDRRKARGARRNDGWLAALASPWDVVAAAIPVAAQVAVAMGCALAVGGLVGAWGGAGLRGPYFLGAITGVLLIWRGPGSVRTRRGWRVVVEPLNHMPRGALVPIIALALTACLMALSSESYGAVWWPAEGAPEVSLPFVTR